MPPASARLASAWAVGWPSPGPCTEGRLKVVAPFYGQNPRPLGAVARVCPVVGSYPDPDFSTAAGRKLDETLDTYNIPHDIKVYPGTRHSFFNESRGNYNAEASADAWERTLSFFKQHLGSTRDKARCGRWLEERRYCGRLPPGRAGNRSGFAVERE